MLAVVDGPTMDDEVCHSWLFFTDVHDKWFWFCLCQQCKFRLC